MKLLITVALISTLVALGQGQQQVASSVYNCSGKPNGNYNHPTDCTKFISCSNGYTYEMDCPACHLSDGPNRCPAGKLHYYQPGDRCEWADVAQCSIGATSSRPIEQTSESATTTADSSNEDGSDSESGSVEVSPTTESPEVTTEDLLDSSEESGSNETSDETTDYATSTPSGSTTEASTSPQPGEACDPDSCEHIGDCTHYKFCNKQTKTWTKLNCSEGLFWNPDVNKNKTGGLGGSCDFWANLSNQTQTTYQEDKKCFPLCYYEGKAVCSPDYIYHPEKTEHRNIIDLSCPKTLIWNQKEETCDLCSNVQGCTGC